MQRLAAVLVVGGVVLLALLAPGRAMLQGSPGETMPISEQAARGLIFSTVGSCGCAAPPAVTAEPPGWQPMFGTIAQP